MKKALRQTGEFRAAFEDKLLASDIVVLKAWVPVDVPRLYNPVTNLLGPPADPSRPPSTAGAGHVPGWVAMRRQAEVLRAKGLSQRSTPDSIYRPIERAPRRFNPLRVPASLQASLPFKAKPKLDAKRKGESYLTKRAVVVSAAERRRGTFMQQLQTLRNAKEAKHKAAANQKRAERDKALAKVEKAKAAANQALRKRRFRRQGIEEEIKAKIARRGGASDD